MRAVISPVMRDPDRHWCVALIMVGWIDLCGVVWKLWETSNSISGLVGLVGLFLSGGCVCVHAACDSLVSLISSCCICVVCLCISAFVLSGVPSVV